MTDRTEPSSKQPCRREDALAVLMRLREAGHVAYFAGGCVRDELMGLSPKDYDIATDAPPGRVRELFRNTQAVGAAFGVILVRQDASIVEVATFRTDGPYLDGRRPSEVRFTTAEEDAKRRDFTINGLFLDPTTSKVIDFVGGQDDLQRKVLRAIGEPVARFEEDHLRMLRAVRFASRFDLSIDPATADSIRQHADKLKRISPERIAEELRLMLRPPSRSVAWKLLWEVRLMPVIFRAFPEKAENPALGDPLFLQLAPGQSITFGLALAAIVFAYRGADERLLTHVEARRSMQVCRSLLRISNDEAELILGILSLDHLLLGGEPRVAMLKRFLAKPHSADARRFLGALVQSRISPGRIRWLRDQLADLEKTDVAPPPLLTGDDLVAMGYTPGPAFKRVLDLIYDEQLEGEIPSIDAALQRAKSLMAGSE